MLTEIKRAQGKVLFEVTNTKGKTVCFRVFPEGGLGSAQNGQEFKTKPEALSVFFEQKKIDSVNDVDIYKLIDGNGLTTGYAYTDPTHGVVRLATLTACRHKLGATPAKSKPTAPKSANPQNRPGYSADKAR